MPIKKRQREFLDAIIAELDRAGAKPPPPSELARSMRVPIQALEGIFEIGIQEGEIVRLENGFCFATTTLRRLAAEGFARYGTGEFDVPTWRDDLDVSRETAHAILEQLETMGLAESDGAKRRLKPSE